MPVCIIYLRVMFVSFLLLRVCVCICTCVCVNVCENICVCGFVHLWCVFVNLFAGVMHSSADVMM